MSAMSNICFKDDHYIINDVYDYVGLIDCGSSNSVYKVRDKKTGVIYATKNFDTIAGGGKTSFNKEMSHLTQLNHPNIVKFISVVFGRELGNAYVVMEYCEKNLADVLEDSISLKEDDIKTLMLMLFEGLLYLHERFIIHRDINPTNILLNSSGILKIADFGSAINSTVNKEIMDSSVGTRWYRAPELLFGCNAYTTSVDMWAAGCVFGELLIHKPVFPGKCDMEQISLIVDLLDVPNEDLMPGFTSFPLIKDFSFVSKQMSDPFNTLFRNVSSACAVELLIQLLKYNFIERFDSLKCLSSPYFKEYPLPKDFISF